jgi:transcriptional regulator with XRE-family HTH domain
MMNASAILRAGRRRRGLTQRGLARRAGVPQPTISRIERGLVSPSADTLQRLLRVCGMELAAVERPGAGVDRTLIQDRLRLTPGERVRQAALEWRRTEAFRRRGRRAG